LSLEPLSLILNLVFLVVGAVLGVWYTEFKKRPQLIVSGSGTVHRGIKKHSITVTNNHGWIGLSLGPTAVLGRHVHGGVRRGIPIERNAAKDCRAHLFDKATGRPVTGLHWRSRDDPNRYDAAVTIPSGEQASLMLFAALEAVPDRYFVFEPDPTGPDGVKVPPDRVQFSGEHNFEVRISSANAPTITTDVTVRPDYSGHLYVEQRGPRGGGSSLF
jgi:hypothetical protein